ncbi:N-acetyltransferase [Cryobacterium adonitolivorans]|uniref:N-acetyltransferase n=1 Tax=Cryobacterium adonitolivorans TaxID=1259189 RepID=A0A4R8W5Q6_9MICO|nr:GNAT family N-acetyltransferase [Cryobacterium adonitolivorans]TFC03164.1 N-acetyltransferase [Cryobacterium adonitolivorans]
MTLRLPVLPGVGVTLRAFRATDAPLIQEASGDELIPVITSVPATDDHAAALAFIARQHERSRTGEGYSFAIAEQGDRAVGQIGLWPRANPAGSATVGYWIRPTARRRGHAAAALGALVGWAATLPGLSRLELYVEPWNIGSARTAERAGFERHELMPARQLVGGTPRDMVRYSLVLSWLTTSRPPR